MFVTESSIFQPCSMKLRICSMEGADLVLEVSPDYSVDKLKVLVVGHFYDPSESDKTSLYHKLVHVEKGKVLHEENTLIQEGLKDNDELLLLKKRLPPPPLFESSTSQSEEANSSLSEAIKKATEDLPAREGGVESKEDSPGAEGGQLSSLIHFQAELRKILISLVDAAQKLLCLNPEAAKIFKEAEQYLEEQNAEPKVEQSSLKPLLDMGFPENRAAKALLLNKMSPVSAIQWLLEHENDPDIDTPIPGMPEKMDEPSDFQATSSQDTDASSSDTSPVSILCGPKKVSNILNSFKALRRRKFRPNPRAVRNLIEMGFEEKDVIDALRISGNKEDDACEWLLGGNKRAAEEDLDEGLDPDGPIYKAIMSNPVVQLGLNNPRSLLAFLHMLENPNNTQQWLNDPDTGPMLIQISRIYHAEKHAPPSVSSSSNSPLQSSPS